MIENFEQMVDMIHDANLGKAVVALFDKEKYIAIKQGSAMTFPLKKGSAFPAGSVAYETIDEYILLFPPKIQEILNMLREVIKESAPNAKEKISYQMPTFVLNGNLVHFAAHKNHIGFYPTPSGINAFKQELSDYKGAKGSIQFPIEKPLPYHLISKIVKFRVAENIKRAEGKLKGKDDL